MLFSYGLGKPRTVRPDSLRDQPHGQYSAGLSDLLAGRRQRPELFFGQFHCLSVDHKAACFIAPDCFFSASEINRRPDRCLLFSTQSAANVICDPSPFAPFFGLISDAVENNARDVVKSRL